MPHIREAYVHTEILDSKNDSILYNVGETIYIKKERDRWYPGQEPTNYYFSFYTPDGYYLNYTHDNVDDKINYIT